MVNGICGHYHLVGGWATPLKNISQLGWLFPIYGKIKNVPNHQPATYYKTLQQVPHESLPLNLKYPQTKTWFLRQIPLPHRTVEWSCYNLRRMWFHPLLARHFGSASLSSLDQALVATLVALLGGQSSQVLGPLKMDGRWWWMCQKWTHKKLLFFSGHEF